MVRSREGLQGMREQKGGGPGWGEQQLWSGGVPPHDPAARQGAGQNEGKEDEVGEAGGGQTLALSWRLDQAHEQQGQAQPVEKSPRTVQLPEAGSWQREEPVGGPGATSGW
jgi:hypothetical protein